MRKRVYVKLEDRYLQSKTDYGEQPMHYVQSVVVSPNGEKLTCVTKRAQLYWALLYKPDDDNDDEFDVVSRWNTSTKDPVTVQVPMLTDHTRWAFSRDLVHSKPSS